MLNLREQGGLSLLLSHNKTGFKPPTFNKQQHRELEKILHNPTNNITGYVELNEWVLKEFNKQVKYNTLLKIWDLFKRNGWTKHSPRPHHPKKDKAAQEEFKKNSKSVWMPLKTILEMN